MFGQQTSSSGEYKMLFDTTHFWNNLLIFFVIAFISYQVISRFLLSKTKNQSKNQNLLLNLFLVIGLFFIFQQMVAVIGFPLFIQTLLNSVVNICVLVLATTGIVLIFKTSITTNFAQGMIATFGAYVAAKIIQYYVQSQSTLSQSATVMIAMLGAAMTSFILGVMIDTLIIRKAKRVTSVGKQMITMGLVLVFSGMMPLIFGILPLEIPRISYDIVPVTLFGLSLSISLQAIYALIITVVLLTLLFSALRFTKWGLGVRATASNEVVASMMGVNTRVITAMSWAIAGAIGGVAAVLQTPVSTQVSVALMVPTQVNGFMAAILGSFSSFLGPLLSSILIPVLTGLFSYFVGIWSNALTYLFILLVVLIKPLGLFGKRIAKKV